MDPDTILENDIKIILFVKTFIDLMFKRCKEAVKMAGPVPEYLLA